MPAVFLSLLVLLPTLLAGPMAVQKRSPKPSDQEPPPTKKPVLVREEVDKPKEVVRDPAKAEEEVKIGDFYFKRENYKAALSRYQEALLDRPDYAPARTKLILAYEKLIQKVEKSDRESARKYMREYIEKFPKEKKAEDYQRALGADVKVDHELHEFHEFHEF
ncbi:MAG TPA: outer membrane protein assembly factor BamD [Acidobacteriota bacterium]|jgi:tetratricopeptide (TPR) repeat protein